MPPKKTTKAAVKRSEARQKKAKAKKNMDTYFLKTRMTGSIVPSQGVAVSNYTSNFFQLLNGTSQYSVTKFTEFLLFAGIYDQCRINRMRVKVYPKANMLTQVEAQNEGALNVSGDGKVHTCVLRDPSGYSANVTRIQRQPSYKPYSVLKPFTRTYGVTYPKGVWLNCQKIYEDETLLDRLGCYGGVGIYAENMLEENAEIFNEPWAALEIEYDVVFRGKVVTALSVQEDGTVCVAPHDPTTNPPESSIVGISGTVADTQVSGFDEDGKIVQTSKTDATMPA